MQKNNTINSAQVGIGPPASGMMEAPRSVSLSLGWHWFAQSWRLFAGAPSVWLVAGAVYIAAMLLVHVVPVVGGIAAYLLSPISVAAFTVLARRVELGEVPKTNTISDAVQARLANLCIVGGVFLVGLLGVAVISIVLVFAVVLYHTEGVLDFDSLAMSHEVLFSLAAIWLLLGFGLSLPLMMATWFAPVLIIEHDTDVLEALRLSFVGCARNILPFLLWGILMFLAVFVAMLPLMLGVFVVVPVYMVAPYLSYKDIFLRAAVLQPTAVP